MSCEVKRVYFSDAESNWQHNYFINAKFFAKWNKKLSENNPFRAKAFRPNW
jgi:hypothetical protein